MAQTTTVRRTISAERRDAQILAARIPAPLPVVPVLDEPVDFWALPELYAFVANDALTPEEIRELDPEELAERIVTDFGHADDDELAGFTGWELATDLGILTAEYRAFLDGLYGALDPVEALDYLAA